MLFQEDQHPLYEADCTVKTVTMTPAAIDQTKLGSKRALNIAMLGQLSRVLDIPVASWLEVIREELPAKVYDINVAAFELGRQSV